MADARRLVCASKMLSHILSGLHGLRGVTVDTKGWSWIVGMTVDGNTATGKGHRLGVRRKETRSRYKKRCVVRVVRVVCVGMS